MEEYFAAVRSKVVNQKARDRLIDIIKGEVHSPGSLTEVLNDLGTAFPDDTELMRFICAKDDQHRHAFYLKSQHVWYRRFGWKIMRPMFVLAVIAAVVFSLQRAVDPTIGVACFLAGAAAMYATIQVFANRWAYKELAKLDEVNARYRQSLEQLLGDLKRSKR